MKRARKDTLRTNNNFIDIYIFSTKTVNTMTNEQRIL